MKNKGMFVNNVQQRNKNTKEQKQLHKQKLLV